jgi:outer membrane lipoprotein-sorting protein
MRILSAVFCLLASLAFVRADSLSDILARMDRDAPAFHGLTANLVMDTYQKIIDSHTEENGSLQMQRSNKGEVRAIIAFTGNSARTIGFQGKSARIYYPAIKQYQDVSLGSNAAVVNQFLLLGFGSSGKELARSYKIAEEGEEKVAGQSATKLLLIPNDPGVLERLTKVELWIPDNGSNPIQQMFYEPSGNYRKITYSDIRLNPIINGTLELKVPKDAKKQRQ